MNILITGIEGFVGSYLAEYILDAHPEYRIHGTRRPKASTDNLQHIRENIDVHEIDITDAPSVYQLIDSVRPQIIFHLAAQSYVRTSWESPQSTITTNVLGQANLLEAVRQLKSDIYNPPFLITGSSEEYGLVEADQIPIKETAPLQPLSPYAVSKIGQDYMGFQYFHTYGLKTIRLRVFNHTGPRRPTAFGDSHLAHTIALIEQGLEQPKVTYRNLDAVRDFTDVRDIVRAYVLAAEHCKPGEVYNVCSGIGVSIRDMYNTLLSLSTKKDIELVADPGGPRPTDGGIIIGDNTRFVAATGWQPQISFLHQTLPDILEWWRDQLATHVHETIDHHTSLQR